MGRGSSYRDKVLVGESAHVEGYLNLLISVKLKSLNSRNLFAPCPKLVFILSRRGDFIYIEILIMAKK